MPLGMSVRVIPEGLTEGKDPLSEWEESSSSDSPDIRRRRGKTVCLLPAQFHHLLVRLSTLLLLPSFTDSRSQFLQLSNVDEQPLPAQKSSWISSPESTEAPSLTD